MIKKINIDGVEMTAVILGDVYNHDPELYRKSLLDLLGNTLLDQKTLESGVVEGSALYDCLYLARALEGSHSIEEGGKR